MFCGIIVKPGQKVKLDSTQGDILHLSQACLSEPRDNGRVYLQAIDDGKAFTICSLQKGTVEHANLDLFLSTSTGIELSVIGKNEVHVSGFYEPEVDEDDFDDEDALMELSDEDIEDIDDPKAEGSESTNKESRTENKKNLKRKLPTKSEDSTDEEIEDEEIDSDEADDLDLDELVQSNDDDEEDEDDEDEDDDGDEDNDFEEDDDEEEEPVRIPATSNKNKQSNLSQKTRPVETQPPSKKSKTEARSQSKPDQIYEESIVDFLKKNGRTNMAMIGNKIKRPEGVSKKLGSFIAERSDVFKVENNMISLVK
ncbi:nuclear factor NF3 [Cryptosporidium felis]|nr:nuclear factor NF3 [Cryptosporidium felis]